MKNATVFALSSRFEGFGMVLVEALVCGCPIVSTDCESGPSEVLMNGKYGVLVDPESVSDLTNGLEILLLSDRKRQDFSERGAKRSLDFTQANAIAKWETILFNTIADPLN